MYPHVNHKYRLWGWLHLCPWSTELESTKTRTPIENKKIRHPTYWQQGTPSPTIGIISQWQLITGTIQNEKKPFGPPTFYWQEADWGNYSPANMCYLSWKRKEGTEGGTKSPESRAKQSPETLDNYLQALKPNPGTSMCPVGFHSCYRPVTPLCLPFPLFEMECL